MRNQDQQMLSLMEKLFDAKLKPLTDDMGEMKIAIAQVNTTLNGTTEKRGLIEEVRLIKGKFKLAVGVIAFVSTVGFNLLIEYLKGFFGGRT